MRRDAARIGLLLALVVAGSAASWPLASPGPAEDGAEAAAPASSRSAGSDSTGARRSACAFAVGEQFVVHHTMQTQSMLDQRALSVALLGIAPPAAAGQAAGVQTTTARAQWQLHLRVLRTTPGGASVLAARMAEFQAAPGLTDAESPLQGELHRPFLIELGPRCALRRFAWHAEADPLGSRTQQALVATIAFDLPADGATVRFAGEGMDAVGRYRHRSVLAATAHGLELARRKVGYATLHAGGDRPLAAVPTGPGLTATLTPGRWFERLELKEALRYGPVERPMATAETTLTAVTTSLAARGVAVDADDPSWIWGELLSTPARRAERVADQTQRGVPFDDAIRALERLHADPQARGGLIDRMVAWVLANPGQLGALRAWIQAHGRGSEQDKALCRILFEALGQSGLGRARAVLRSFALDLEFYEPLRVDAAFSLSTARGLGHEDVDALLALAAERRPVEAGSDIANYPAAAGAATLGAAVRTLREAGTDPSGELTREAIAALDAQIRSDAEPQHREGALMGVGNAGAEELFETVQPLLADPSERLRELAARALRRMPATVAVDALLNRLAVETSPAVKASLLRALLSQAELGGGALPNGALATALSHLGAAQPPMVQAPLMRLLLTIAEREPAAKAALVEVFRREHAKGVAADRSLMQQVGTVVPASTLIAAMNDSSHP